MSEAEQTQDTTGRLLAGRYRLGGVLGRGGMGTVWRARDETLGRTVAVKELRFPNSVDEDEKRRLITRTLREAKAIARIRSNGAVTVYDVVDEDDRPWIVMELIEGRSLADVVRDDGPLTSRRAAEVGLAVLDVLRAAHREGILHRDVKPSNVLIADDGRVVLTDFGIAQVEGDPSVTSTGMLVGAPSYISPERARGHKPGPPADLWSLGGLLYAAVEGVPPYDKSTALATLTAVMTEPLDPPKNAGALEEVIYGLLDKDPERRLDDAGARTLLNAALSAPERTAAAEATRAMPLPPAPPAAPSAPPAAPKSAPARPARPARPTAAGAADRKRPAPARPPREAPAKKRATPGRNEDLEPTPPAPPRASITDVVPRRTLVIVAVVIALAVIGTVLVIVLSGGDKDDSGKGTGKGTAAGAGRGKDGGPASGSGDHPDQGGTRPATPPQDKPADQDGSDDDGDSGSGGKDGSGKQGGKRLPGGYAVLKSGEHHFTIALPKGWTGHPIPDYGGGRIYRSGGDFPRVQVDFNGSPRSDAAAAWRSAEGGAARTMPGYRGLGIHAVGWRGYPTVADWSFERRQGGTTVRVLNRGFKADEDHGYAIMITCEKDKWDEKECRTLRQTAFATFRPTD
ncbi:serine/threonine protein kinase [Streptomyces albus subsp. albus]|nr:serine/threonine protein kinase [Streptomyces albus subsp. albus]